MTKTKSISIIEKIVELANKGHTIRIERDLGGNTLTVYIDDLHTHVGVPEIMRDEEDRHLFDIMVNNLYDVLVDNKGLSWSK
jgi:hypothetical protein